MLRRNSPFREAMTAHFGPPVPAGGGGGGGIPSLGIPFLGDALDIGQKFKNLFSDPNKMEKRRQSHQTLLDFITILAAEAERRQSNIQGVKDAERRAPIRASLMSSLMSGGLEGFGSEFSPLRALARPRSFITEGQGVSVEGPEGAVASPQQLAQLDSFLEPAKFASLREKGRQAAAGQSAESLFTPTESPLAGGLAENMQFGVNKEGDLRRQREILGEAAQTGLTPEQEAQFGVPGARPIVRRAMGGPVEGGQTALVGERGPELIRANQNLNVEPLEDPEDRNRKQLKKVFQILSERGVGI